MVYVMREDSLSRYQTIQLIKEEEELYENFSVPKAPLNSPLQLDRFRTGEAERIQIHMLLGFVNNSIFFFRLEL